MKLSDGEEGALTQNNLELITTWVETNAQK